MSLVIFTAEVVAAARNAIDTHCQTTNTGMTAENLGNTLFGESSKSSLENVYTAKKLMHSVPELVDNYQTIAGAGGGFAPRGFERVKGAASSRIQPSPETIRLCVEVLRGQLDRRPTGSKKGVPNGSVAAVLIDRNHQITEGEVSAALALSGDFTQVRAKGWLPNAEAKALAALTAAAAE